MNDERLHLIIRHCPDLIFQQDLDLRYIWAPEMHCRRTPFPLAMVGKTDFELFSPEDSQRMYLLKRNVIESGKGIRCEISLTLNGEICYFDAAFEPWELDNNVVGVLGYFHEITGQRRAQEAVRTQSLMISKVNRQLIEKNRELDRLNARLEHLSRLKTEFVSMASHELKTPLTSMIAFAQTLLSEQIVLSAEERRRFLEIIESEGMRLAALLNSLLDVSKIEAGVIELNRESFDIGRLITETLEMRPLPPEIAIRVSLGDSPTPVFADKNRIKQVITNFFDNAIAYGGGEVRVSTERLDHFVRVSVSDNGLGIGEDEREKIFEKFYRARNAKTKTKGSGLGLAIAKGIIEVHRGTISVESCEGKGSTFSFLLPCGPPEPQ